MGLQFSYELPRDIPEETVEETTGVEDEAPLDTVEDTNN